jgi:endo-1,4-beta-xylanase
VNEALNDDGTFRNDTFLNVLGPDYIKIAFKAAAAADPAAKLYYNDYNIESLSNKSTAARNNIVKFLQDAGIRIDGVGLQSHFTVGRSPTLDDQIANMKAFTDLGVDVAVTELDVRLEEPENATNLAGQSEIYKNTTGACLQVERCVGITVWDFYDPVSLLLPLLSLFSNRRGKGLMMSRTPGYRASSLDSVQLTSGSRISRSIRRIMGLWMH